MIEGYFADDRPHFEFGERYAYSSKESCFHMAQIAKSQGYEVKFGKVEKRYNAPPGIIAPSYFYYFEIVDPFEEDE